MLWTRLLIMLQNNSSHGYLKLENGSNRSMFPFPIVLILKALIIQATKTHKSIGQYHTHLYQSTYLLLTWYALKGVDATQCYCAKSETPRICLEDLESMKSDAAFENECLKAIQKAYRLGSRKMARQQRIFAAKMCSTDASKYITR